MRTGSWRRRRKVAVAFWGKKKILWPYFKTICMQYYIQTLFFFFNSIETIRNLKDQTEELVHTSEHK